MPTMTATVPSGVTGGVTGGVLADPAFLLALENQQRRLQSLISRVDTVRGQLPRADAGVWRGPAHSVYAAAVDELIGAFSVISDRLGAALQHSRTAHSIAAMQG